MKHKIFVLILALTVASWAQTATQTPAPPQASTAPAEKAKSSCCDKMSAKDGASCARHAKDSTDAKADSCCAGKDSSCCGGKDAMSCMKDKADKSAASCKDNCMKNKKTAAACCGSEKSCGKDCCSSGKKEKAARNCCDHQPRG